MAERWKVRTLLFCFDNANAATRSAHVGLEVMVTVQADIKTSPGADLVAAEGVV